MTGYNAPLARGLAALSAILLVIASGGFGCYFAWTQGQHHGVLLGAFAVAMALGLELAKPLAVSGIFTSFREWRVAQAIALAMLAAVAVAYSLTAELSLMATTRGDAAAKRSAQADAASKAKARYQRAESELGKLAASRPADAVKAEIASIDQMPGILIDNVPCGGTWNGKITREHCPRRAELVAELALSEERQRLQSELRQAEIAQQGIEAVTAADPAATALAHYLSVFGIAVPASVLSEWLVLIGVVALELGSATAGLLMRAMASTSESERTAPSAVQSPERPTPPAASNEPARAILDKEPSTLEVSKDFVQKRPRGQRLGRTSLVSKEAAGVRIVDTIKERGGRLEGASVRGLAALIGGRKSTVHSALAGLVAAGVIARLGGELVLQS